jgi:hypothetical protein
MNDGYALLLFLHAALALLWFLVWGSQTLEARAEKGYREVEGRARREAERSEFKAEREYHSNGG